MIGAQITYVVLLWFLTLLYTCSLQIIILNVIVPSHTVFLSFPKKVTLLPYNSLSNNESNAAIQSGWELTDGSGFGSGSGHNQAQNLYYHFLITCCLWSLIFVGILKATEEKSRILIRIRIRNQVGQIRGYGSISKRYYFGPLLPAVGWGSSILHSGGFVAT